MTNPFATAAPANAANPFATQAPAADPFAGQNAQASAPAGNGQPVFQAPPSQPQADMGDPFATPPPAPELDGLTKSDAEKNTIVILEIVAVESVTSKFPDQKTGKFEEQDRLTVNAHVVTGPKAGTYYSDQWIFWNRVVGQFSTCAGNGQKYLVMLTMDGRAVTTAPVTDPQVRAQAAQLLRAG